MRTSEKCHDTLAASDALKECSRWVKALYRRRWFEFGHSILIPQTLEYWTKKIWFSNRRRRRHRSIRGLVYPARIESRRIRIQSKLRSNVAQNALEIQRRWRFNNLNGVSIQYSPHIRMCCTAALLQLMSNFGNELNFLFLCTFFFVYFLLLLPSSPPFRLNWMQAPSSEHDDTCYGTDLNRNWKHEWNERGSSNSPCSDFYAGPKAFSDPETKALSEYLQDNRKYLNVCQTFFFSLSLRRSVWQSAQKY